MNTGSQAAVPDQLSASRKAGDVTNRTQNGHTTQPTHARELNEKGELLTPGFLDAELRYFGFHFLD
jgi:hypothetical protein